MVPFESDRIESLPGQFTNACGTGEASTDDDDIVCSHFSATSTRR